MRNFQQAVILVGGLGSRLGKLTKKTPKPLLKIDGHSFIDYQINFLSKFPFKEILLLCGYKGNFFKKKYHLKKKNNTVIKCIIENKKLGTGGALINAKKNLKNYFLLCNGDTFFEFDLIKFYQNFDKKNFLITIAIKKSEKNERFSGLKLQGKLVKDFLNSTVKKNNFFNAGYYFVSKKILNSYKKINNLSLEEDIIPPLVKRNKVTFEKFNDVFFDIGVKEDLYSAKKFFKKYNRRKFVILDRDGIINFDTGYLCKFNKVKFIPGILKFIKYLYKKKIPTFVVTNQSGIARGYYEYNDVKILHQKLNTYFASKKFILNQFYFCPHHIDGKVKKYKKRCNYRKPGTGFYEKIKKEWILKSDNCLFIDDKKNNLDFAKKSNIKPVLFNINKEKNIFNKLSKLYERY